MSEKQDQSGALTARLIELHEKKLHNLRQRASLVAAALMRMAGAIPCPEVGEAVFWVFSDTGEHATVDRAIGRVGAHPAMRRHVAEYGEISREMVLTQRSIERLASS